jgi:putative DNA primase/helicase
MIALLPHHLKMLQVESAITPQVIEARGYRSVTADECYKYGITGQQARDGLLLPVYTPDGGNGLYVLRPDNPRIDKKKQEPIKYEWPKKTPPRVDCPPVCLPMLKNPAIPLWITEGQKKGDLLASLGLCVIDFPNGVWGFKSKEGILADLDHIAWDGREVNIIFDSDVSTKPGVAQAMRRLTAALSNRGAKVTCVPLPEKNGKTGVDDFIAQGGTLEQLLSFAQIGKALPIRTEAANDKKSTEYLEVLKKLGHTFQMRDTDERLMVSGRPMSDGLRAKIRTQMRDLGYNRYLSAVEDTYLAWAHGSRFHPVKDYLSSLKWDGYPYIAHLAAYFSDTDNIFGRWLKVWLVGAVAKAFEGAQNPMLVLDSRQGLGKSYFAAWLGGPLPDYYIEAPINPDDKDNAIRLMSKFVWEVAELGSTFRRSDREALKFFLTQQTVTVRVPYAKHPIDKPAMASFIGTINNEAGFLTDPTGNRRFLVCELTGIDWAYTKMDVNNIWAEAYHEYKNGYDRHLTPDEVKLQQAINSRYRIDSHVMGLFFRYFDFTTNPDHPNFESWKSGAEILQILGSHGLRGNDKTNAMELAAGLKELGIEKAKKANVSSYRGVTQRIIAG